jgi:hypothetical protein
VFHSTCLVSFVYFYRALGAECSDRQLAMTRTRRKNIPKPNQTASSAPIHLLPYALILRSITLADYPGCAVCWQSTRHCGLGYKETHMIKTPSLATWMLQLRHDDQSPQTKSRASIGESARCVSSLCATTRSGAYKRSRGADGTSALPAWAAGGLCGLLGPSARADAAESRWDKLCSGEITVRRYLCCGGASCYVHPDG